jgi:hypothetical protein
MSCCESGGDFALVSTSLLDMCEMYDALIPRTLLRCLACHASILSVRCVVSQEYGREYMSMG